MRSAARAPGRCRGRARSGRWWIEQPVAKVLQCARIRLRLRKAPFLLPALMFWPSVNRLLGDDGRPRLAAGDPQRVRALTRRVATRSACVAAPTPRAGAVPLSAAGSHARRPLALGVAFACLDRLANGTRYRQTRDGHRLASARLPRILGVEESSPAGSTDRPPSTSAH